MNRFARLAALTVFSVLIFANLIFGQADSIYRLPAGTHIRLRLDAEINSKVSSVNDTFIAAVTEPVRVRDTVMLPVGTEIEGRISGVSRASAGGHGGRLEVVFETLKISNTSRRIDGILVTPIESRSSRGFNILSILGGIVAGVAVGATNSTSGALIGAGIGGGAGTTVALLRKGKDARIRKGEEFEIELRREVILPVLDY